MFDYTHLLFTLKITQTSAFLFQYQVAIEVVESEKDVENASKIIDIKENIEKTAKKKIKKGEESAQIKDESFGQGSKERTNKSQVTLKTIGGRPRSGTEANW